MENFVYVANDVAPSEALKRLNEIQPATTFLNFGKKEPLDKEVVVNAVRAADFVLIGMSNPAANAEVEIAAASAATAAGKPFAFYADIFGAYSRKWFAPHREHVKLVFVIAQGRDVDGAQALFPNAKVVCSYNPLWSDYFVPADWGTARKLIGATDEEFVILTPGEKHAVNNIMLWGAVVEAAAEASSVMSPIRVVIGPHPGDTKTPPEVYAPLVELGNEIGQKIGLTVMMTPPGVKNDQIVPGLVKMGAICQRGNSSLGIHGICRRVQVVDYYGPISQALLARGSGGDLHGYYYRTGVVADLYSAEAVAHGTLAELLYDMARHSAASPEMRRRQEQAIPFQEPGTAVANMKRAIEELLG